MAEKLPTTEVLARIEKDSAANHEEVFTRLFRYMLRTDIWYVAYQHLYANDGAATKGINNDTADGFGESKVRAIIASLQDGIYRPLPVRRTYIPKRNNPSKKRPLGIPTFTDKLVQEVVRMILEAVYEPTFLPCSHGFRPARSCHTALKSLRLEFCGAKWFIEGDIKGCFDNINHNKLIDALQQKIKDARLIQLICQFLKAGYLEDWMYHRTYSGTPQGGIISPILANIYLHELDKHVMKLKEEFDAPSSRLCTHDYYAAKCKTEKARKAIRDKADSSPEEKRALVKQLKAARAVQLCTPCKPSDDKKIKYIRYADDFILAVSGTRAECELIKENLTEFVSSELKMELSQEKTLITHSSKHARFLGYDISVRRNGDIRPSGRPGITVRSMNYTVELLAPMNDKIIPFLLTKGVATQSATDNTLVSTMRTALIGMTDLEIVMTYNSELRGVCNYYALASNFGNLSYFAFLMEYSCLKTLARKHKCSIAQIRERYKDGHGKWCIPYQTKTGKHYCYFAKFSDCKDSRHCTDRLSNAAVMYGYTRTTIEARLSAHVCELCGKEGAEAYEIHHVHKVKDLQGKADWERAMIAKRRKTLVVCRECHHKIHNC